MTRPVPPHEPAAEPRPAATLVLLRQGRSGPEVLLTRRPQNLRFMGGAVVFPGGAVAEADLDPAWERASTRSADQAARALGLDRPAQALGAFVCALREAFEEVGFLAGSGPTEELRRSDAAAADLFLRRCLQTGVILATDALVPAGRWVTPVGAPRRFDAHFFLAAAPDGWEPRPDASEVAEWWWLTPSEALTRLGAGEMIMAPPTVEMLQHLDAFESVHEALQVGARTATDTSGVLVSKLSPVVTVVLAPNAGTLTGPGTNTYVVGSGPTLVIDPAVDDEAYLQAVLRAGADVSAILVTHRHPDHVGGAAALAGRCGAEVRALGDPPAGAAAVRPLADGERLAVPGASLAALHTPGHAPDHLCFYLEGSASLFSGDNILGEGTAVIAPPDGDMATYIRSLRRLLELPVDRIYPGHWRPLDGGDAVIRGYLQHRQQRERSILSAVAAGCHSIDEIVETVYGDVSPTLHPVAAYQVRAHLEMMLSAGQVVYEQERWMLGVRR